MSNHLKQIFLQRAGQAAARVKAYNAWKAALETTGRQCEVYAAEASWAHDRLSSAHSTVLINGGTVDDFARKETGLDGAQMQRDYQRLKAQHPEKPRITDRILSHLIRR